MSNERENTAVESTTTIAKDDAELPNITHRLVGAVVLVVFAVVVLPLVLSGTDRPVTGEQASLSNDATGVPLGRVVDPHVTPTPIVAEGETESSTPSHTQKRRIHISTLVDTSTDTADTAMGKAADSTTGNSTPVAQPEIPISTEPKDVELQLIQPVTPDMTDDGESVLMPDSVSEPAPVSDPPEEQTVAAFDRGWVVRIGTFAVKENADRIVHRLADAGFDPQTTLVDSNERSVTRVWVGPFRDRVTAARQRTQIERATKERGFIAPYP